MMNFVVACLYAVCSSTLMALALALVRGGLNPSSAALSLGFGSLVAAFSLWQNRHSVSKMKPPTGWEWGAIVAFALVCLRMFLWLIFKDGDSIKVVSPNNLGDLSLHLTYIEFLASGVPFWPDNPIYGGGKLTYPIGVDLFNSLLVLLHADVLRSLVWCGLAGSAMLGVALWRWGRGFTLFGFLANGGVAGFAFYYTHKLADFQADLAWKSFALALLATQRGLLYALPAGIVLLISWRSRFFHAGEEDQWRLPVWGEVLLYATMPLFHFHTFLFLSLMLGAWFVLQPTARRGLIELVGVSVAPASALVFTVSGIIFTMVGTMKAAHVLGFKAGWMWDDETYLHWCEEHLGTSSQFIAGLLFWPLNFGVLPIAVITMCVVLLRRKEGAGSNEIGGRENWHRAIVFPALLAFLICCFVKFAPWEWDNTKIMIWAYIAILPSLWTCLIAKWPEWARALACFALFWSGFVSTLGGIDQTHEGYEIATRSELVGVKEALRRVPTSERFVGYPTYNHPLLLCGRKMALGYLGHVSSHGLAWQEPAREVTALMNGEPDWMQYAAQLHVRYLFWGRPERDCEEYRMSTQPWKNKCRLVASGAWGDIYDLQTAAEK